MAPSKGLLDEWQQNERTELYNEAANYRKLYTDEMQRSRRLTWALYLASLLFAVGMLLLATPVWAHDATPGMSREERAVAEMYAKWGRPKGNFSGIEHRKQSCCDKTDCGVVLESRRRAGKLEVRVCTQYEVCDPDRWYPVDPAIMEENQGDPVESPDGRAHACVVGGQVVCYVGGGGA